MTERGDFQEDLMSMQACLHDMDRWILHATGRHDGFSSDRVNDFLHRLRRIEQLVVMHERNN